MIEVNEKALYDVLLLAMAYMDCLQCPWWDDCNELEIEDMQNKDCANLAIKCLQRKEEEHD